MRQLYISFLAGTALFSALTTNALAKSYYVSPTGSDSNAGTTSTKPWKTITKVNSTTLLPGDQVLFQGGKSFAGNLYVGPGEAGTASKPIVFGSYGTGRATINAGTGTAFYAYDTAGIRLEDLVITGVGRASGNYTDGISFYTDIDTPGYKLDTIQIDNVDVSGFGGSGIIIGGYAYDYVNYVAIKTGFKNVSITNVAAHDNADAGITTYGSFDPSITGYAHENVYVGCSTAYHNYGIAGKGANSGNGIVLADVNDGTIENCTAYNNGEKNDHPGGGPVGIWAYDSNAVWIQFNTSYSNKSLTNDGGGFDLDGGCTNSVMQYNYSQDNVGNGYLVYEFYGARPMTNNFVRYNISVNDGRTNGGGLAIGGGTTNTLFEGNTVYITSRPKPEQEGPFAAWVIKDGGVNTNVIFRNNNFISQNGATLVYVPDVSLQPGIRFQSNLYLTGFDPFSVIWGNTTYRSLAAWRSATGQEK